ncbi:MAG: glycosyltransferase [Carbonactinosporaceae bacterium]
MTAATQAWSTREHGRAGQPGAPVRAALLLDHPAQHFSRGFQLLASHPELELRVYYWDAATGGMADPEFGRHIRWAADLHSGYPWWSPPDGQASWRRCLAAWRQLRRDRPQVILSYGWGALIARLGILFAIVYRTPLLFYGDSTWQYPGSGRHPRLRNIALPAIFRIAAGAVSTGTYNREFYIAHGLDPQLVHHGVCPADTESFAVARSQLRPASSGGSTNPVIIGFVGKFLAHKAPDDLVEAVERLPRDRSFELWLIGDGPMRSQLELLVRDRCLTKRVKFLGFRNTDELPSLMGAIDVLVVPSHKDRRVHVAIEAMAAGAALILSTGTAVWGPGDLVEHEATGLVYPAGDIDALSRCLLRLVDDAGLRARLAADGQVSAQSFGPQNFAATITAALVATAGMRDHAATR